MKIHHLDIISATSTPFGSPTTAQVIFLKYVRATRIISSDLTFESLLYDTNAFFHEPVSICDWPSACATSGVVSCFRFVVVVHFATLPLIAPWLIGVLVKKSIS